MGIFIQFLLGTIWNFSFKNLYGIEISKKIFFLLKISGSSASVDDDESLISQSGKQHFLEAVAAHTQSVATKPAKLAKTDAIKQAKKKEKTVRKKFLNLQKFFQPPPFVVADVGHSCADGWEHFERKCIRVIPIERSWPQALAFCARFLNFVPKKFLRKK